MTPKPTAADERIMICDTKESALEYAEKVGRNRGWMQKGTDSYIINRLSAHLLAMNASLTPRTSQGAVELTKAIATKVAEELWVEDGQIEDCDAFAHHLDGVLLPIIQRALDAGAQRQEGVWPNFIAPAQYENPDPAWVDPKLPDFTLIWKVARELGYSVGLHGSMRRDCDLIAAPWVENPSDPDKLIHALCEALNAKEIGPRKPKPCGRIAVNLSVDGYVKLIDLSIMPMGAARSQGEAVGAATVDLEDVYQMLQMAEDGRTTVTLYPRHCQALTKHLRQRSATPPHAAPVDGLREAADRLDYILNDPEGARHLLLLLQQGKGNKQSFLAMVDRIRASKAKSLTTQPQQGAE